jgi:hypothetical protein
VTQTRKGVPVMKGKIVTWSVRLREAPEGEPLPGFLARGESVEVKTDDGTGWLLVVATVGGERRLGYLDGCYLIVEPDPGSSFAPRAPPEGGFGVDAIRCAQQAHRKWRIPASAMLGQWALASDFGRITPQGSRNPFRVLAAEGEDCVEGRVRRPVDGGWTYARAMLRKFGGLDEAFEAHARAIAENAEFAEARLKLPDRTAFARALGQVGDFGQGEALSELIRYHNLTQFD